jgi:hypothetical protein
LFAKGWVSFVLDDNVNHERGMDLCFGFRKHLSNNLQDKTNDALGQLWTYLAYFVMEFMFAESDQDKILSSFLSFFLFDFVFSYFHIF